MFVQLFQAFCRRKRLLLSLLAALTVVAALCIPLTRFDTRLEVMMPREGGFIRTLDFLREARFSDKIVISLRYNGPEENRDALHDAVDALTTNLDHAFVRRVLSDVSGVSLTDELAGFVARTPEVLGEEGLREIAQKLTPESVERELRARRLQLLKPEGSFMSSIVRRDPLNFSGPILRRLQQLTASFGYNVHLERGHLLSEDGRHALVVLETPVPMTDGFRAKQLLDYLESRMRTLPPGVDGDIVCAHRHTVSNEQIIRADIKLTLTLAGIGFAVLFLVVFRDPRATLIFLTPFAAVALAIVVCGLLLNGLSALVIGLGSVIAGIAVDYGIHVFVAVKKGGSKQEAVHAVARPVLAGALTTMGVFAAFFCSSIRGYHQLALFSLLSIAISLFYSIFVLPQCLVAGRSRDRDLDGWWFGLFEPRGVSSAIVALTLIALLAGTVLASRAVFDSDVTQLDGTATDVLRAEERFQEVWGRGEKGLGLLVCTAATLEEAAETNDEVTRAVWDRVGRSALTSLTGIWPSARTRAENVKRWQTFWNDERRENLRTLLNEKGKPLSFAEHAFDPLFAWLEAPAGNTRIEDAAGGLLTQLKERFVRRTPHEWHVISYFPDRADMMPVVNEVERGHDGVFVVSREEMTRAFSRQVNREVVLVAGVALLAVLLITFGLLRSFRMACVALVPALAGCIWLAGVLSLAGRPLNFASLISGVVVMGLCIDYGIFMTYAYRRRHRGGTTTAVTLSAVTTLMGAGVLLFAGHPVLLSIGRTLVIGVLSGYIASMVAVPALCRAWLPGVRQDDASVDEEQA